MDPSLPQSHNRVYFNHSHLAPANEPFFNDICKALWSGEPLKSNLKYFRSVARAFQVVDSPAQAELFLLPLIWNYYLNNKVFMAEREKELALSLGHRLIVFSRGSFTANIPFSGSTVFENSCYASRSDPDRNRVFSLPFFIDDYLHLYCQGKVHLREKEHTPVIGFCGNATSSFLDYARHEPARRIRKWLFLLGLRKWEPAPFQTLRWRMQVLKRISRSSGLRSNFILHRKFQAGHFLSTTDPFHPLKLEFVRNILDSDYTVCMRGNGNFSMRFYETLALGRIPVFVNTDCKLPFDHKIDYRQYCIWVEQDEIPQIGEKILAFHESISPSRYKEMQAACYALWRERLSKDGFYAHFAEHFS